MDRSVQVVDQLRADRGLRHYQFDGGERVVGIAVQHGETRFTNAKLKVMSFDCSVLQLRVPAEPLSLLLCLFGKRPPEAVWTGV